MIFADIGLPTPLELTLFDGEPTKGVRAFIKRADGSVLGELELPHVGNGTYMATITHDVPEFLHVTYVVFDDTTYAEEDPYYSRASEVYRFSQEPKVRYENRMSTALNPLTKNHEVIVWPERDGLVAEGSDCRIEVKTSAGSTLYQASIETPNSDRVFYFTGRMFQGESDKNYYIKITIKVDGADRTSYQTFFTVG